MDFRYSPDEVEVHRYARESFRAHLPLSRLHDGGSAGGWASVARDGWLHACLPEPDADVDLPLLVGLAREAGAVAAGEEFVHNGWLLPRACAEITDAAVREAWLAEHLTTPGYLVEFADSAVVPGAHSGFDCYRRDGDTLRRRRSAQATVDSVAGLSLSLGRIASTDGTEQTAPVPVRDPEARLTAAGAQLLRAAVLVGSAAEILDRTVAYVSEREQFGQPIGSFQAVKHLCADVHADVQVGWFAVLYAAVRWAEDPLALDQATNQAAQAALGAARTGSQLHGGMGFTWESDLHWLLKSVLDAQVGAGTAAAAATRIGAALLETT